MTITNAELYRVERKDAEKTLWVEEFSSVDYEMASNYLRYRAIPHEDWRIRRGSVVILIKGRYEVLRVS